MPHTADSSLVLIENQIEKTDHTHLGQLMTYAAGLEAATIVWIASRFVDEHRAAMDWLNEITGEKFAFFGLEIELYKTGESAPAPKFNIVCKPNDWTKAMQSAATSSGLSETKAIQLSFWTGFRSYMESQGSSVKCQKPLPQHWMNHSIGRSRVHMCSIASTWDSATGSYGPEIRVELYLDGEKAKPWFEELFAQKDAIEKDLGYSLVWHNPETTKMSKMYVRKSADSNDEKLWPDQY